WRRENKKEVAVKKFQNAINVSSDFLNEVNFNLKMNDAADCIETVQIYGVTCDPQNGEYAIVTEFKNGGDLRKIIKKKYSNLTWKIIIEILRRISSGLFWNLFDVLRNNNNSIELITRLAELDTNPIPLKKSQNLLTSKRLDYSQSLSQKLSVEDWNKLKLTD
ncbi:1294_t:CDS:2, partial [Rhizophagus irregularis]